MTLGVDQFRAKGSDSADAGPLYIRKSDAEYALEKGHLDG